MRSGSSSITFSVIIPTYDQVDFLQEALESVYAQRRAADEVIVVDDESSDATAAVVRERFPDVVVVRGGNLGQSIARNTAIAMASGQWLCFLDHDDLWHRDKLAAVEAYLVDHPRCRALHHPVWNFSSEGGPRSQWGVPADFVASGIEECYQASARTDPPDDLARLDIFGRSYEALLDHSITRPSAVVLHRAAAIQAGCFPPGQVEDWRLFRNVARFEEWYLLEDRLSFIRMHGRQTTQTQTSGVFFLAAYVDAWLGGRVRPHQHLDLTQIRAGLVDHRDSYRAVVQSCHWEAMSRRDWSAASLNRRLGGALLPRRRDRLWALMPPRVTHRLVRRAH